MSCNMSCANLNVLIQMGPEKNSWVGELLGLVPFALCHCFPNIGQRGRSRLDSVRSAQAFRGFLHSVLKPQRPFQSWTS